MAKNSNKRTQRAAKNNRSIEHATSLLTAGFLAEFYLLMVNNYFVKGTVDQLVAAADFLQVLVYVGTALVGAGVALLCLHKKSGEKFGKIKWWLLVSGVFFTLSSELMLKVYPQGTTAMCIIVPVITVMGIIFLMFPREFSTEAVALASTIAVMILTNKGAGSDYWGGIVKAVAIAVLALIVVISAVTISARKNDGAIGSVQLYGAKTNYSMLCIVMALCVIAIVAVLCMSSLAYYGIWAASILAFALAVYYTVKMM